MIPLKQLYRHEPKNGIHGDCHRAAIASILELPINNVPHFGDGGPDATEFVKRVDTFLWLHDMIQITILYNCELSDVLYVVGTMNPDTYYLLGGRSKNAVDHTVVCLNDQIVHDPAIDGSGIVGPCNDGFYWITFIGSAIAMKRNH